MNSFEEKDLEQYTNEQKEAITSDNNLRIIACAGSGKTKTLVGKIKYLLENSKNPKIEPENIIAFTYTEKAANELKSRVVSKIDSKHGIAQMFVGTIHGWCLKVLQDYLFTKYQNYSVLSEIKLKLFVDKYYYTNGMVDLKHMKHGSDLWRFKHTNIFLNIIDIIREQGLIKITPEYIKDAIVKYEKSLTDKKYLDFTMLLTKTLDALNEDNELTKYIAKKIKYLIVDEYQDVNNIQNKLIKRICDISQCKIIVVGDDDQNIYKWRGSNNTYIRNFFKKDFKDIYLTKNFRSSEGIVVLASTLIENNEKRLPKNMESAGNQEYKRKDILFNQYANVDDEDKGIAKYIKDEVLGMPFYDEGLKSKNKKEPRGITYSDICILVRYKKRINSLTKVFDECGIDYITAGVTNLFEQKEIIASVGIFEYLNKLSKTAEKYIDQISSEINTEYKDILQKIINNTKKRQNKEKVNIEEGDYSKESILKILQEKLLSKLNDNENELLKFCENELFSKWEFINSKDFLINKLFEGEKRLITMLPFKGLFHGKIGLDNEFLNFDWEYNLQEIFQNFFEVTNFNEDSIQQNKTKSQVEIIFFNLGKFSQVINDYEEVNFTTTCPDKYLEYFLKFLEHGAKDYYEEGWVNNTFRTVNAVQIMTIHQAKGLEFPVVVIPGLNENFLPGSNMGGTSEIHFLPDDFKKPLEELKIDAKKEDERRLFYVAITRSQKYLFLSQAPVNKMAKKVSRFIKEMESPNILIDSNNTKIFPDDIKIKQQAKNDRNNLQLDFTTLSDYFYCPYKFKLVSLYGFCTPLNRRMGYGKSFHSALMEYHIRRGKEEVLTDVEINDIVDRQTYFPYQSDLLAGDLKNKLTKNLKSYHSDIKDSLRVEYVEQDIQYKINDDILIVGKVDLIKNEKNYNDFETVIVDFKTKVPKNNDDKEITDELTNNQLNLYAIGYKELTGENATSTQIFNLDYDNKDRNHNNPKLINNTQLEDLKIKIRDSVDSIKTSNFLKCNKPKYCDLCKYKSLCI
ncbi:ATP-dependent DNA helicase [Arcobacter aquimarinus]|uniref:DNA 3'-5' helicase n=1 Tax=Arcobacter aquimarinus TaxID=1315211 RepID=A0AAE7E2D4_9BACT|nr:ATP-dependent DNA helicase [Arcobacter aquimarinus]QKE27129.1 UvrD/REP family helicase [Arcobacter aquimarinus]RXI35493.1 hypothetical protein CP986_06485 [Arcobacter aquimarinus]